MYLEVIATKKNGTNTPSSHVAIKKELHMETETFWEQHTNYNYNRLLYICCEYILRERLSTELVKDLKDEKRI